MNEATLHNEASGVVTGASCKSVAEMAAKTKWSKLCKKRKYWCGDVVWMSIRCLWKRSASFLLVSLINVMLHFGQILTAIGLRDSHLNTSLIETASYLEIWGGGVSEWQTDQCGITRCTTECPEFIGKARYLPLLLDGGILVDWSIVKKTKF